jgi:preprotein translocase subunit SecG
MQNVLLVIQLLIAVALISVILLQRTAQDGGGLMGGGNTMGGLFTARGSANLLTRTTAILATLFIVNSLALAYIASSQHQSQSVLDQIVPSPDVAPKPVSGPVPSTPPAPAAATDTHTPAPPTDAPKAPMAPQVPLAH